MEENVVGSFVTIVNDTADGTPESLLGYSPSYAIGTTHMVAFITTGQYPYGIGIGDDGLQVSRQEIELARIN